VHGWLHLQHFFSSLLSWKEFWAALIGLIGAFTGAVIGGRITGRYALRAQEQAAKDQRTRDRDTEREMVRGTLEAIATEVEVFKVTFLDGFEDVFRPFDPGRPFAHLPKVIPLKQGLSIVFDSNAAVLGRINDAALRRKVVVTYVELKAIIDVVNHYAKRRELFETVRYQPSAAGGPDQVKEEVETWAKNVREHIPKLQKKIADLLAEIRNYLDRQN
jgi:hypothetical protein